MQKAVSKIIKEIAKEKGLPEEVVVTIVESQFKSSATSNLRMQNSSSAMVYDSVIEPQNFINPVKGFTSASSPSKFSDQTISLKLRSWPLK